MNHARATVISVQSAPKSVARTPTLAQTTCPYCGVGCGVDITLETAGNKTTLKALTGTPEHPANFGRLCVKGTNLLETNDLTGRLTQPQMGGKPVSWDTATSAIAEKMQQVIDEHGPDAVALYVSGQLLTEDYYVANKFMKGFVGSANIDTNSRLCMSSAVAAYKRAFGEDIVPCNYEDLEQTDLLILTGSNAAWTHPVLFQRMERAKRQNPDMKVVVVDPRATDTSTLADLHIPLKPGTDAVLFNGLLHFLAQNGGLDTDFIAASTNGFEAVLSSAAEYSLSRVAEECDVPEHDILALFTLFLERQRAITFFSMGINQSTSGVDKGNAIINCHLATGKIGKTGSGPFSITGQPNAMGGREVGGLANMLAAHMDIDNAQHRDLVQRFWQSPRMADKPGLKAVDLFKRINEGKVKFVWIMATNPVVSMPNRCEVEAALSKCDMVVVSDMVTKNDTLKFAHIALPASGWSEKNGTVTNSERRISRQRGLLKPAGESRHDWQALCAVAAKMGFAEHFDYQHPAEIFDEHARLTAFENHGDRALDLGGLSGLTTAEYDNFRPVQWPVPEKTVAGATRLFADGAFFTADKKARFIAISPRLPEQQTTTAFPFVLNTGRSRDQWHTMTRTGKAGKLLKHAPYSQLSLHPEDIKALGLSAQELVAVNSACNTGEPVILPVVEDKQLRKGNCFAPIHWSATWGSNLTLGALFNGAHDPLSGQPELKQGAVSVAAVSFNLHGQMIISDADVAAALSPAFDYWAKTTTDGGTAFRIASNIDTGSLFSNLKSVLPAHWLLVTRQHGKGLTVVATSENRFVFGLWLENSYRALPDEWLDSCLQQDDISSELLANLLRGTPDEAFLNGKLVCSCFSVREKTIETAIQAGCSSVDGLGNELKCGTNCGSCKPELQKMLDSYSSTQTAKAVTPEVILHD